MKRLILILMLVAQNAFGAFGYYRSITIDHTKCGASDSTNFAVLISSTNATLKSVANGGHVQSGSGYDIRPYSDSALTTALTFELGSYDAAAGTVLMWVKVPTVSHSVDTVIYLAYGNASLTTDGSSASTWDANFLAVYHLGNGITLSVADSTGANNLTNSGLTAVSGGQIDGGAGVGPPAGGPLYAINSAAVNTANCTIAAWVNANAVAGGRLFGFAEGNNGTVAEKSLYISNGGKPSAYGYDGAQRNVNGATTVTTGVWHYMVVTWDSTNEIIYFDGASDGTTACGATFAGYTNPNLVLGGTDGGGGAGDGSNVQLDGSLDEVRVSNTARSADWILTSYNTQKNPGTFYTLGSEITVGGAPTVPGNFFIFFGTLLCDGLP